MKRYNFNLLGVLGMERVEVINGKIKYLFGIITILTSILIFALGRYSVTPSVADNKENIAANKAEIEQVKTTFEIKIDNLNDNIKRLETAVNGLTAELKAQQTYRR